jgi:KDO2-lipid IV(A) lauroyltransferase
MSSPPSATDSKKARVVDHLLSVGLGCAIRLAEELGVARTLCAGHVFGRVWRRLHLPRVARVRAQLAAALPEESAAELAQIERDVFCHLGQGLAELLLMSGRHRRVLLDRIQVEGLEHLEEANRRAGGVGAVVIGPHLGNWELGAAKLAELGVPVSAVYRDPRQPALERAVLRYRGGPGAKKTEGEGSIQQIPMGRRAGVQFVRALGAGRNILALLDQHARDDEGILVSFFGMQASTRFAPLKLADRAGAPVLCAFARRDPDGRHHRLTFHPALQLESGGSDDREVLKRNVQTVTTALEREIRGTPGQWIWTHRRWREPKRSVDTD